jgi:type IV pilus assembly protein PilZ
MSTQETTPAVHKIAINKPGVLSLAIKEKTTLYSAYMPFVTGGGLFIPTNRPYKMGDEIFMMLNLPEDTEKMNVAGKVVWVNPVAQNGKPQGVGVQFHQDASGRQSKEKIEALLGNSINSSHPTHTI